MLEQVERANLFLVPLDETRGWWRYHHLFADLLRARLQQQQPIGCLIELRALQALALAARGDETAAVAAPAAALTLACSMARAASAWPRMPGPCSRADRGALRLPGLVGA
jgi:ATP/maltotriose-dependent transcriptional regulator MalT